MENKAAVFSSVAFLFTAGLFVAIWRAPLVKPGTTRLPGGLVAVDSHGAPIPLLPVRTSASKKHGNRALQELDGLLISLRLEPSPPSINTPIEFRIVLTDTHGQAVTGAVVSLDLVMPGLAMPPNSLDLNDSGGGEYSAWGRFNIRGLWRMEVNITLDGQSHSVYFVVWL